MRKRVEQSDQVLSVTARSYQQTSLLSCNRSGSRCKSIMSSSPVESQELVANLFPDTYRRISGSEEASSDGKILLAIANAMNLKVRNPHVVILHKTEVCSVQRSMPENVVTKKCTTSVDSQSAPVPIDNSQK